MEIQSDSDVIDLYNYANSINIYSDNRYEMLQKRITEVGIQLEKFREKATLDQSIRFQATCYPNGTYLIDPERISLIAEGISGSYYFFDEEGNKKFIIKPIDEDCGCINNPKGWGSLETSSPVRDDMPLYCSSLKEAATFEIANVIGLTSVAPVTSLKILESEQFFFRSDMLALLQSKEKLCSVQQFIPMATSVFELFYQNSMSESVSSYQWSSFTSGSTGLDSFDRLLNYIDQFDAEDDLTLQEKKMLIKSWLAQQKNKQYSSTYDLDLNELLSMVPKIIELLQVINQKLQQTTIEDMIKEGKRFLQFATVYVPPSETLYNQQQFEDLVLLIWTTYDTDAHFGNILAHPFETNEEGKVIYGLKKIDNGLSFPTKNRNLRNPIIMLSNAEKTLSEAGREKILAINEFEIANILSSYDLDAAIPAFYERVELLKSLVQKPNITLKQIDTVMCNLGHRNDWNYNSSYLLSRNYA